MPWGAGCPRALPRCLSLTEAAGVLEDPRQPRVLLLPFVAVTAWLFAVAKPDGTEGAPRHSADPGAGALAGRTAGRSGPCRQEDGSGRREHQH